MVILDLEFDPFTYTMNTVKEMRPLFFTTSLILIFCFSAFIPAQNATSPGVKVLRSWELPAILTEVSGIATIDIDRIACIQDELGTIFIYNINTRSIEREIPFGPAGDYEGITLVDDTAWVLRSDGRLFEVRGINNTQPTTREYTTGLTAQQDVEGLGYDAINHRLLLAIKESEPGNQSFKGIYAFNLGDRIMQPAPVFRLDLQDERFGHAKKKANRIMPSDIAVHPSTRDLYIVDGPNSKLLVLHSSGAIKNIYPLDRALFPQPEGISFFADGKLFISNEGKGRSASILEVETIGD